MAIDPNISLSVKVPEPLDLVGARMKQMNLQQLSQQGQLTGLQIDQARLQQADQAKQRSGQDLFSRLLSQHSKPDGGVDSYAVEKGLAEGGYGQMAVQYGTQSRAESKVQLDNVKTQLENSKNRAAIVGSMAGSIMGLPPEQRPIAYARFIEQGQRDGLFKPGEMPPAYDENFVAQGRNQAIQANDQIANAQKDIELQIKNDEFKQKTAENSWKNVQEQTKYAAGLVAATNMNDPVQVEELRRTFDYAKVSPEIRAMLLGKTPQQAMTMGMTPEQQAQAASTAAGQAATMRGQDMQAASTAAGQGVTVRGQDMTDTRARELNEITRNQKPPTSSEQTAAGYYGRALSANRRLEQMEGLMVGKSGTAQVAYKFLPNMMQTEENQLYKQAQREFTEARLRKESGAAIANSEYENDEKTFFPQPGDQQKTLKQKAEARLEVLNGLRVAAGRAAVQLGIDAPTATAPAASDEFTAYAEGTNGQRLGWNGSAWVVVNGGAK